MTACAGVMVVVDSHPGVREVCDPAGGGRDAASLFTRGGWRLTRVASTPGFVCRIDGQPSDASCAQPPPAGAYWSLWVSDGPGRPWEYAALGVDSQTVPRGGSVAFSWDDRPGDVPPSVQPGGVAAASATAVPSGSASSSPSPASSAGSGGGVPGWLAPGLVGAVVIAGGAVALLRRRRA